MPIAITSVSGVGGDPPNQIVVTGTVETCERVEVTTSCSRQPVLVDIPTGGAESWSVTLPNDEGCRCGAEIKVSARCTIGQHDQVDAVWVLRCGGCQDDPAELWDDAFCLHSLSKNVSGRIRISERSARECREAGCRTLRTSGTLTGKVTSNAACDSKVARPLRGVIEARLVSAYDTDATRRGIHAGSFEWQAGAGTVITGELSGTVNAGILRGRPFEPACEECHTPAVLIGRLCGQVARTDVDELRGASVLAVYRLLVQRPTATLAGAFKGTLEGAVMPPC